MKTFGELEIGDILYSINDMDADWGEVTKHKITGITSLQEDLKYMKRSLELVLNATE